MLSAIRQDVHSVLERDPAARSTIEVLLCYPGLHALWAHRVSHWLWRHGARLPARVLSFAVHSVTGIDIHPGAEIGRGLFIDHGSAVVIGETAEIGVDVTIYQGVTLGGTSLHKGKRHPTIGDRVVVGAGAKVLGAFTVGHDSRIGANAVVVKPVPPNTVVVGVPGEIVQRHQQHSASDAPDLEHGQMPDVLGDAVLALSTRLQTLERKLGVTPPAAAQPVTVSEGVWNVLDYTI
jgi:serine O-acetyltransferase